MPEEEVKPTEENNDNNESQEEVIEEHEPASFDYNLILDDEETVVENKDGDDEDKKTPPVKKSNKAVDAINTMRVDAAIDNGINTFFANNPEAKEYQATVEKFVKHAERMKFIKIGLPVETVIAEALAPYQQRIGALKAKAADEEASKTNDGGGSTHAKPSGNADYSKMSSKEVRQMARDVESGRYKT